MRVSDIIKALRMWHSRNEYDLRRTEHLNLAVEDLIRQIDRLIFNAESDSVSENRCFDDIPHWMSEETARLTVKGLIRRAIEQMFYRLDHHKAADEIYVLAQKVSAVGDNDLSDVLDI